VCLPPIALDLLSTVAFDLLSTVAWDCTLVAPPMLPFELLDRHPYSKAKRRCCVRRFTTLCTDCVLLIFGRSIFLRLRALAKCLILWRSLALLL
jgi:hypothetical protein